MATSVRFLARCRRLCETETAVDGDHLPCHTFGSRIGEAHDPSSDITRIAAPLERYSFTLLLLDGLNLSAESLIILVKAPDSVGPDAMALTRMPWSASWSAQPALFTSTSRRPQVSTVLAIVRTVSPGPSLG
jgi:hypothetical protein